ncbi:MAG TPA: ABC transporter permease [Stellaceae bacterium]|jgi:NitT/TauT family transport system permease protein|nr:ABC transporter permease [Stellaceae bacterium]
MSVAQDTASLALQPAVSLLSIRAGRLLRVVGLPVVFAVAVLVAWECFCRLAAVSPVLLPPPSAVWAVLRDNPGILLDQATPTMFETILSFALASGFGVALAVVMTLSARVREAIYPNIVMFQLIPKIALAPLFIVWLGVGSTSIVTVGVFIAFFPVVVSTITGLVAVKPDVLQLCRSLNASEWQTFRMARFPYAMPFVFAGMKVGVTMAIIGVVVGEFITAQAGLGYIIMFASSAGETATVLAAIVMLCGIGLGLYGLVAIGEMAVRRWFGGDMPIGGMI